MSSQNTRHPLSTKAVTSFKDAPFERQQIMVCLNEIGAVVDNVFDGLLHNDGFGFFRHSIRDAGEVLHQHSEPRDAPVTMDI